MSIRTKLGDWWRGYTNEDLLSLSEKLRDKREPGAIVPLTQREWNALRAHGHDHVFIARQTQ